MHATVMSNKIIHFATALVKELEGVITPGVKEAGN